MKRRIAVLFALAIVTSMFCTSTATVWALSEPKWTETPAIRVVMKSNSDWATWVFRDPEGKVTNGIRFKEVLAYAWITANNPNMRASVYAGSAPSDSALADVVQFGKASATGGPDFDYTEMYADIIFEVDMSLPGVYFAVFSGAAGTTTLQLKNAGTGGILWEQTDSRIGDRGRSCSLSPKDFFWDGTVATLRDHGTSKLAGPANRTEGFAGVDSAIYFYWTNDFKEPYGRRSPWRVDWYAPNGTLYYEWSSVFLSVQRVSQSLAIALKEGRVTIRDLQKGIWHVDLYANEVRMVQEYFTIGDYLVEVKMSGLPSTFNQSVRIMLDGSSLYEVKGEDVKSIAATTGNHTLSVQPSSIEVTEGSRYVCSPDSWMFSSPGSHTFDYVLQYKLTVEAPIFGSPTGSGWYRAGETASFNVQPVVGGNPGVQYIFTGWTGDYSGTSPTASMMIDGPKKVTAVYKTQFYLKVTSAYDDPKGEGWYDQASTATFSVTPEIDYGNGTKRMFVAWTGDSTITAPSASILMNSPRAVEATWRTETNLLVAYQNYVLGVAAVVVAALVTVVLLARRRKKTASNEPVDK
jgi:hypothetical protein